MNHAFLLRIQTLAADRFYDKKYQSATVQCRQWKQIHDAKVCRQQNRHIDHI